MRLITATEPRVSRAALPRIHPRSYRGNSVIRNSPPPYDHHRALGIALLYGPRGRCFRMSEAPLYATKSVSGMLMASEKMFHPNDLKKISLASEEKCIKARD